MDQQDANLKNKIQKLKLKLYEKPFVQLDEDLIGHRGHMFKTQEAPVVRVNNSGVKRSNKKATQ